MNNEYILTDNVAEIQREMEGQEYYSDDEVSNAGGYYWSSSTTTTTTTSPDEYLTDRSENGVFFDMQRQLCTVLLLATLAIAGYALHTHWLRIREKRQFDAMATGARAITESFEMTGVVEPEEEEDGDAPVVGKEVDENGTSSSSSNPKKWLKTKMVKSRKKKGKNNNVKGDYVPPPASDDVGTSHDDGVMV